MLIGIDARSMLMDKKTGVELYVSNLILNLAKVDKKNQYDLYFDKEPSRDFEAQFPTNFHFRVLKSPKFWTQLRLPLDSFFHRPDVFFFPAHSLPLLFWKPKSIIVVHDLAFLVMPEKFRKNELVRLTTLTKNAVKKAKHIIAISMSTKEDIVKYYKISPDKISAVYHGYDKKLFRVSSTELVSRVLKKYSLKESYFIFVATLHFCNVERLIRAFAEFKKSAFSHKLVLVGKPGWQYQKIIKLIKKLGIDNEIILPGYVSEEDLPLLLQGAVALVFPSFYEGFGLPPLEAMAVGTPVIVSNNSSLPEVVGNAGIFINSENEKEMMVSMKKIINDKKLVEKMKKAGFKQADKFSWEKCARETLGVLEKVAESKN